MKIKIIVASIICIVVILSLTVIINLDDSNDIDNSNDIDDSNDITNKTFLVGLSSYNGMKYIYQGEYIVIFTDGSIYDVSYRLNSNDSYSNDTIILEGENNTLTISEIRYLFQVTGTIPGYNVSDEPDYGYTIGISRKSNLTSDELNNLTGLIETSGFLSLNNSYFTPSEYTDGGTSYITVFINNTWKTVSCIGTWPTSYSDVFVTVYQLSVARFYG